MAPKKNKNKAAAAAPVETVPVEEDHLAVPEAVSGDKIKSYCNLCIDMMKSKACRDKLKDVSIGRPGVALIEMQKEKWDELKVPRESGRSALDGIEKNFPDDYKVLSELRGKFVEAAKAAYMQALQDRKPVVLITEGELPRDAVLEFFDSCNIRFDEADIKARLKKYCAEHGCLPDPVVEEVHNEMFENLGFEAKFAKEKFTEMGATMKEDSDLVANLNRWQRNTSGICMDLLREAMSEGTELKCKDEVKVRILEVVAREALASMTPEDRGALLNKNGKKVQIFRGLPAEDRQRHLEKMADEDKIDLMKTELLVLNVMQLRQKDDQAKMMNRSKGRFKPGTEFKTTEVIKTVDKNVAAIAKNTLGRVLVVDADGDLRVVIPTKDRPFYFISSKDLDKLRVIREGFLRLFEGQATHAAFGNNGILVHITLTSAKTGMWSMLGQTADMKVEVEGDGIVLYDDDTRFEGKKNNDGNYEGTVTQEGDSNGHFILRAC